MTQKAMVSLSRPAMSATAIGLSAVVGVVDRLDRRRPAHLDPGFVTRYQVPAGGNVLPVDVEWVAGPYFHRASGPPMMAAVLVCDGSAVNRGRTVPYSKRGRRSTMTSDRPERHRTRRRTEAWASTAVGLAASKGRTGMQSVSSSSPSAVVNVVTKMLVAGR